MAEILVSAFLSVVFEKLGSRALEIVARSKGIHSELKNLETSLSQIQALLNDASQKEVTDESVKVWLNRLQHLTYDIDDVLDDLATEALRRELTEESRASTSKVRKLIPTSCCTSFSLSASMQHKLDDITTKLQDLEKEKVTLGLIVKDGGPKNMNRRLFETSLVDASSIVGRQDDKEALLHKVLGDESCDKNYSIVPIVGMGGVGKTTLARLLFDETQVKDHFELKAWVCVSDDFDIFRITNIILQSIGGEIEKFADANLLQVALKKKLSKKRFLIVLDDVWSESYADWEILARPFLVGAPGSKVIITTRKLSLLTQLGYDQPYCLRILSDEDALSLFAQNALGASNFDSHPTLRPYGEGIVNKCKGLPLALIALGRSLRSKTDKEWKEVLNSEIWRLPNADGVIPALRLSYYDLSAPLKRLFAYCSFFPKDYVFLKEELILLWMAEGFLHQLSASKSSERLGHEYFEELLSRSFFEPKYNDEFYAMHDLMNDLATSVAGDFFSMLENEKVRVEALEKYRHMSIVPEEFLAYGKFKVFERARSLRTFLLLRPGLEEFQKTFFLSNKILIDLIPKFPLLRVLYLGGYEISEVPESIGTLKHLRYLNLSRTKITHLPQSIGGLYNLQTLIVFGCGRLTELPKNISKLRNLRHLGIGNTPLLKKLPLGIGELKSLRTLSKVIIEGANGFALSELKQLKDLCGRLAIKGLEKVKDAMEAKNSHLFDKELGDIRMEWSDVFDGARNVTTEQQVFDALKPHNDTLTSLVIVSYGGMEFPSWVGDPSFLRLSSVTIVGCKNCTSLPPLGQLPLLKELFVEDTGLEVLGNATFPALETLSFKNLPRWKEWSTKSPLPFLDELSIECCPNLVQVSLQSLPKLRELNVTTCGVGVLRSLVQAAQMVTTLEMKDILGLTQLNGGFMEFLGTVKYISISECNEIRYLWESEAAASKFFVKLERLEVSDCKNLVSFGEKEEDNGSSLTSLRVVLITNCDSFERYNCPKHIQTLSIYGCGGITSISCSEGVEELQGLGIVKCEKLLEEEFGGRMKTSMLLRVLIHDWSNLKSVIGLSCFIHLTFLSITGCENLESFPDNELSNLTSLTGLEITSCPNMNGSFPRGFWPPKLSVLKIGVLKKPISEWGQQNFPTSLVTLILIDGPSDNVGRSSQLSHLLPSSLTYLGLWAFESLDSLSTGLEHLISLRRLHLSFCMMMRDLPESLLPSLLEICLVCCPSLEKKCSRKGSYWPRISHIPCIRIEDESSSPPTIF